MTAMSEQERYEILKKEVDSLQAQLNRDQDPWYKKPSNLISAIALLFSFGTTIVSYINSHAEDVRSNHREAMQIIQRITKLPYENFELLQKYKNSGQGQALSGMINQENILLATQATNLIKRYPDTFSATEFFSVATALATSNIVGEVPYLFETAIEKAETSNDYSVSTRSYAYFLYSKGDYTEGKKYYEMALDVWSKFPERNMYIVNSTDLLTLMYWSQAELMVNNIRGAEKNIDLAKEKLEQLPSTPMTQSLAMQINETIGFIEQAKTGPGQQMPHPDLMQ